MDRSTPLPEILQDTNKKTDDERGIERATEYFKKMFSAHSTIKYMKESIDQLYISASYISPSFDSSPKTQSDPKRLESTIIKIADLKSDCEKLLVARTSFDKFVFRLSETERTVLVLRCKKNKSWKEISADLDISRSSAERAYQHVCTLAEQSHLF